MGMGYWQNYARDSGHASSDASLFSSSLPILSHEKFNRNEVQHGFQNFGLLEKNLNHVEDEDRLFDGPSDDFDISWLPDLVDDSEDCDIFRTGGGLELEPDLPENFNAAVSKLNLGGSSNFGTGVGHVSGEHPLGEHPSRTLFVRNINSSVEDMELRSLFEPYGDIRALHTATKNRGFVMIHYYDIRAARNAMRALQNKPLRRRKLDIHFSIPKENPSEKEINQGTLVVFNLDPSVSNEDLWQIFGAYGEVKEIRETPHKRHHKFIEFYDSRAAEAALKSLNRSDIAGKRIKVEPSRPGGARRSLILNELEQSKRISVQKVGSPIGNSPPGNWQQFCSPTELNSWQNLSKSSDFSSLTLPTGKRSPGLASLLQSQMRTPVHTNGYSHHRDIFEQPRSFPEPNLNQFNAPISSFDSSTFSESSMKLHSASEFLWGSPELTSSSASRMQEKGRAFLPNGNNEFRFLNHGSFHQHVGSAPSGVSLERNFGFYRDLPRTSIIDPYLQGIGSSPNARGTSNFIFPINGEGGSIFKKTSPQQMSPVASYFSGFASSDLEDSAEHGRSRRVESNGIQIDDKKQFQLDLDKIKNGGDTRTTLMIKNIPNKYTSKMLLATIDEHHRGTYDFLYLPIDFKNKCNVGYAFINMLSPAHIIPFYEAFNGKKWEKFNSEKVASLAYARIQGKAALVAHFQNSSLMNEDKWCRPIILNSGGRESNDQESLHAGSVSFQVGESNVSNPTTSSSGNTWPNTSDDKMRKR